MKSHRRKAVACSRKAVLGESSEGHALSGLPNAAQGEDAKAEDPAAPLDFVSFLERVRLGQAQVGDRVRLIGPKSGIARVATVVPPGVTILKVSVRPIGPRPDPDPEDDHIEVPESFFDEEGKECPTVGAKFAGQTRNGRPGVWEILDTVRGPHVSFHAEDGWHKEVKIDWRDPEGKTNFWRQLDRSLRRSLGSSKEEEEAFRAYAEVGACVWRLKGNGEPALRRRWKQIRLAALRRERGRKTAESEGDGAGGVPRPKQRLRKQVSLDAPLAGTESEEALTLGDGVPSARTVAPPDAVHEIEAIRAVAAARRELVDRGPAVQAALDYLSEKGESTMEEVAARHSTPDRPVTVRMVRRAEERVRVLLQRRLKPYK